MTKVLGQFDVTYWECGRCGSLQTDPPHWLSIAYAQNLSNLDTGAGQRVLQNFAASFTVATLLNLVDIIDIGGGDGLLCRLLRDMGLNCYVQDKYAAPTYAQGYTSPAFQTADLILAFEVVEHYPTPRQDISELFRWRPGALLLTTSFYTGQSEDWWYLAPESGQHVFFYSRRALQMIGADHGYETTLLGNYILLARNGTLSRLRRTFLELAFRPRIQRLVRMAVCTRPAPGVWADHDEQKERMQRASDAPAVRAPDKPNSV